MMTPTKTIEYFLQRAQTEQEEAKQQFIKACEWLASTLKDEAGRVRVYGSAPSETVMSTSLVQDIQRAATEYRSAGEHLRALRELLEAEQDALLSGRDRS